MIQGHLDDLQEQTIEAAIVNIDEKQQKGQKMAKQTSKSFSHLQTRSGDNGRGAVQAFSRSCLVVFDANSWQLIWLIHLVACWFVSIFL